MQEHSLQDEIVDLIIRSLRNDLNAEEEEILREWLGEKPEHREQYNEYLRNYFHFKWSLEETVVEKEKAETKVLGILGKKRRLRRYYGVAASLLLLIGFTMVLWEKSTPPPAPQQLVYSFIPQQTQPRLILSNGEEIGLDSSRKIITAKDGTRIRVREGAGLCYDSTGGERGLDTGRHRVVVPRGGEYYIRLNDGTEVWLNSETEISYPVHFAGNRRDINLKGEAYFKVRRDTSRIFCVHSGAYQLKVYGTEFNLNTYDQENIEAVLVKGRVGFQANTTVREQRLQVNQLGCANSKTGESSIREVDVTPYIAWKNNDLVFMNEELESIMEKVARWYDAEILFKDEGSKKVRFNGNIPKYSDLKKLLQVMEKTSDVSFEIVGRKIYISKRTR